VLRLLYLEDLKAGVFEDGDRKASEGFLEASRLEKTR